MISIIIPVRNGTRVLDACLKALATQTIARDHYEVIVIDDGSTDDTAQVAHRNGGIVESIPPSGPAAARNRGAQIAHGDLLLFTDADCIPAPDWVQRLSAVFVNAEIVGAKGAYRTHETRLVPRFVQLEYLSKYERMARLPRTDFIDTYSAAYRREVFLANGGFDTSFTTASVEDQEFSFRLARKGYHLAFVPDAVVFHRHDFDLPDYFKRKYWIGYWKSFLLRRHPEKMLKDSHTPGSQRAQIALLGAAGVTLALGWLHPMVLAAGLVLLAGFFLSGVSFFAFIAKHDAPVLIAAPLLLVARAMALGLGLVAGAVGLSQHPLARRHALSGWQRFAKRVLDVVVALAGLFVLWPAIATLAVAVKLDSPGSAFYSQERAGENGRRFRIFKLRSMSPGAEAQFSTVANSLNPLAGAAVKIPNDPRVTRLGHFLRRWSLDELPQLWNILCGDMSLVGPRPEQVSVVEQYSDWHRQRLAVKPGLTGPMQVSGRGLLSLDERVQLELDYIENYSLWRDLVILLKTIPAMFSGRGAF